VRIGSRGSRLSRRASRPGKFFFFFFWEKKKKKKKKKTLTLASFNNHSLCLAFPPELPPRAAAQLVPGIAAVLIHPFLLPPLADAALGTFASSVAGREHHGDAVETGLRTAVSGVVRAWVDAVARLGGVAVGPPPE
jgi:hypothetical protein